MVVRGIGKMLNGAIERFLIVILVKINLFIRCFSLDTSVTILVYHNSTPLLHL